jgi:hypothetical protein
LLVLFGVVLTAVGLLLARPPWRRKFRAGDASDLVGLLRGAAERPQAFARVHPLFSRPIVPLVDGRRISLGRARAAAQRGRLAGASPRNPVARKAAEGGGLVVDLSRPEGEAVASALAVLDLDRWNLLLDRAETDPIATQVERALAAAHEPCRVRVADETGDEVAVLDGESFGLGRRACWVVVDRGGGLWQSVERLKTDRPATAVLLLADAVVDALVSPSATNVDVLSELAISALDEVETGR